MAISEAPAPSDIRKGIGFILLAMLCVSMNDVMVKALSGTYPLHELMFVRSGVALAFTLVVVHLEGGMRILRTDRPFLHALRGMLVVLANLFYFAALAALPLAEATALWFVAPLFITLMSVPFLGERVGPWRIGAVIFGFAGVLLMLRPAGGVEGVDGNGAPDRLVLALPVLSAFFYACMQMLTRRLGVSAKASAMAVYIHGCFLVVSLAFFFLTGDGRYAVGAEDASLSFVLRAWIWPQSGDALMFVAIGANSAVITYALSQAYRSAEAGAIAPFEYSALPLAIFWGWAVFGHLPGPWVVAGIALIVGAGMTVFLRERRLSRPVPTRLPRRW
jgi:S-adenosylmethionine uptake transporter